MKRPLFIFVTLILVVGATAEPEKLDRIQQQGYIQICADPSNLPFSSTDTATPGFEVELARLIARELGVEARFHWRLTYIRALRPLSRGACDLFMGLPKDDHLVEGLPWVSVSRPYYVLRHAIVTRADTDLERLSDLTGKRIAVDAASVADFYLLNKGLRRGIYKGQEKAFRAVMAEEAPAALLWFPVANWLARGHAELRVLPLSDPSLEMHIGAAVRRRYRQLAKAVDEAVGRLLDRGDVQEILQRYGATAERQAPSESKTVSPVPVTISREAGRSVYATVCSRCHGSEGISGGRSGVPTIRNYPGGQEKFLRVVQNGKKDTAMTPFKNILTVEEMISVYQYLTSLPQE